MKEIRASERKRDKGKPVASALGKVFLKPRRLYVKTAVRVDTRNPDRGPLLLMGGGRDAMVPEVVSRAEYKLYRKAPAVTDYKVFNDRGHSLVIDHGWKEIAETALEWLASKGLGPSAARGEVPLQGATPGPRTEGPRPHRGE